MVHGAQYREIECQRSEALTYPALLWSSQCYSKFNDILQQIISTIYIKSIKLYILSSVVICNYAIVITRSMSTPMV